MADIATLIELHEMIDSDALPKKPIEGKQENGCKGEARGVRGVGGMILQQHHKRVKDRRSYWI